LTSWRATKEVDLEELDSELMQEKLAQVEPTTEGSCESGYHAFPNQDFEVGARVCDFCGAIEY
jgi:hypothetical protein